MKSLIFDQIFICQLLNIRLFRNQAKLENFLWNMAKKFSFCLHQYNICNYEFKIQLWRFLIISFLNRAIVENANEWKMTKLCGLNLCFKTNYLLLSFTEINQNIFKNFNIFNETLTIITEPLKNVSSVVVILLPILEK